MDGVLLPILICILMVLVNCGSMPGIGMGSMNCNGLRSKEKLEKVLTWLKNKEDSIFFIQESHCTSDFENTWEAIWDGPIYFSHGTSNATGVAILIKKNAGIQVIRHKEVVQGRGHILEIEYDSVNLCLVNVYSPNNDDVDFLKNIFHEALGRNRNDYTIYGGDWNAILDDNIDKSGGSLKHSAQKSQIFLNSMITDYGLCDILRLSKGNQRIYTHVNKKSHSLSRLDYFLIDDNLVNLPICSSNVSHGYMTDHSYINLFIKGSSIERGRGYWKLNNSHLENDEFVDGVRNIISNTASEAYDSYNGLWDVIKFKIKDYAIKFGVKAKKARQNDKDSLQAEINHIKGEPNFRDNEILYNKLIEAETKLNSIINYEIKGNIARARAQWVEEGERSTRYFFGLERAHGKKREINKLVKDDKFKTEIYDQNKISEHIVKHFQSVFNTTSPNLDDMDNYFSTLGESLFKIDSNLCDSLEANITMHELNTVVNDLKTNKSPGWDGLTAEFYKLFWSDIRDILFNSFLESINKVKLSPSQQLGIMTLIPKDKPLDQLVDINNWRPITLLNVDYKIFANVIKNRFTRSIPQIISNVQSGFRKGRSTNDNLILICLILEHFQDNSDDEGVILQVDFEKAFDTVEHSFLFKTLKLLGFGDYMINLVKTVFSGCRSYANINGHLSAPVFLFRGLHQGSPLSPILFLFVAQIFTVKLNINPDIHGLNIGGVDILHSLFADDTDLFLKAEFSVVREVMGELRVFGELSGCKCNTGKTKCIPLGGSRYDDTLRYFLRTVYGKEFITNDFKALGIWFNNYSSISTITENNYVDKSNKATGQVSVWSKRDLTIMGKVTLIKSLIFSQFSYLAIPLISPSSTIIKSIEKLSYHFLWGCKRDKISRDIIARSKEEGGLGLFRVADFLQSLKLATLSKLFDNNFSHAWKSIVLSSLKYPDFPIISIENNLISRKSDYIFDLLNCYYGWRKRSAANLNGGIDPCVWHHNMIPPRGSHIWHSGLIENNILYVSDFINDMGGLLKYNEFLLTRNIDHRVITSRDYNNIYNCIKHFNRPSTTNRDISKVVCSATLKFFAPNKFNQNSRDVVIGGKTIRKSLMGYFPAEDLTPLKTWQKSLGIGHQVAEWGTIMYNCFTISNNLKIVQFQYKLLMRISTCKYMRHKMNLAPDGLCGMCGANLETLDHIFLICPTTHQLVNQLNNLIIAKIDSNYIDVNYFHFITCNHTNKIINYLNAVCKWYISRSFQYNNPISWLNFKRDLQKALCGEKSSIKTAINEAWP